MIRRRGKGQRGLFRVGTMVQRVADAVVDRLQCVRQPRADLLSRALRTEPRIELLNDPACGYFAWIQFPAQVKAVDLQAYCADQVKFMPGVRCDIVGRRDGDDNDDAKSSLFQSHARLCFADMDEDLLEEGVKRLVTCFRAYVQQLEE